MHFIKLLKEMVQSTASGTLPITNIRS